MDQRRPGGDHDAFAEHTDDVLFDTDVFLTELSKGHDPSEGEDPLAQLLLSFNDEVIYSRAPEPPTIDNAFMGRFDAATEIFEPVTDAASLLDRQPDLSADDGYADDYFEGGAEYADRTEQAEPKDQVDDYDSAVADVVPLESRRRKPRINAFMSGLIGAAAATLVIAGSGAAIYNSQPGSFLWGLNTKLFGDHAAVVELASTLEQVDNLNAKGDTDGALALLEQAKSLIKEINSKDRATLRRDIDQSEQRISTQTVTAAPPTSTTPPPSESEPVPTVTVTVTATVGPNGVVQNQNQSGGGASQVAPTTNPLPQSAPSTAVTSTPASTTGDGGGAQNNNQSNQPPRHISSVPKPSGNEPSQPGANAGSSDP